MATISNAWIITKKEWLEQQSASFRRTLFSVPVLIIFIFALMARSIPPISSRCSSVFSSRLPPSAFPYWYKACLWVRFRQGEAFTDSGESAGNATRSQPHPAWQGSVGKPGSSRGRWHCDAGATVVLNAYLPGRSVIWPPPEAWAFFVIVLPLVSFALSTLVGLMLMFGLPAATVNGLAVVLSVALFSLPGLVMEWELWDGAWT